MIKELPENVWISPDRHCAFEQTDMYTRYVRADIMYTRLSEETQKLGLLQGAMMATCLQVPEDLANRLREVLKRAGPVTETPGPASP